ncbi:MAG: amidohydrolase [Betaproteobacteria bacterium]|nr:amidohydrolase [Betaproteobacteria bacterium]
MELPTSALKGMLVEEFDTTTLLSHARKQAIERNYKDFLIVDVDSHHYENERFGEIIEYLEDPVLKQMAKASQISGRGSMFVQQPGSQDMGGRVTRYPLRKFEKTPPTPDRQITLSNRWMDATGIDYTVLFPTPMLQMGLHPQQEVEVHLARAYNRWLCETVLAKDKRIRSLLYLPFNDPEACYQMVLDFGDKPGVAGFMVTTVRYKGVHDNAYMKTYRAIEERGKVLAFHAGYNWGDRNYETANKFLVVHALGFTFYNIVNICNWVINGLSERFPKLPIIWMESGLSWLPYIMQRLDNEYMMRSSECAALKKKPSEYITDMYYGCQPMECVGNTEMLEQTFKFIKAETQLLYASDYPHWDFDLPSVIYDLPFLDEKQKRQILGTNAQKLLKLPVFEKKLAQI